MTDYQGVSLTEAYDNRSVMAQIARLKDRVKALEESGIEDIEQINEELTILEGKVAGLEEGAASLTEDVAALESGKADNNAVVKLVGNQTIMDVKSFIRSPIVPTPTANSEAATKKYVDDRSHDYTAGLGMSISNDVIGIEQSYADNIVKKDSSNQQTISSSIYFTTIPRAPGTPVNASDLANKSYVDSVAGGGGGGGTYTAGTGLQLVGNEFSLDSASQTAVAAVSGKADDNAVVKLTGAQSVAGVKTFSDSPIVPTPTTDYQVATKKYVDDNAGSAAGPWTTLQLTDFTEAKFNEMFPSQTGLSQRVSTYDVIVYTRMYVTPNSYTDDFYYIPKGTTIDLQPYVTITELYQSATPSLRMGVIALRPLFGITGSETNMVRTLSLPGTGSVTVNTYTASVTAVDTIYSASGAAAGHVNVCIQYR